MSTRFETFETRLVREQTKRLRDLTGYRSTYRTPILANAQSHRFVADIAAPDIGGNLDETLTRIRKHFGYRRRELSVSEPDSGIGAIHTPEFDYSVHVTLDVSDYSRVQWRTQVQPLDQLNVLFSDAFVQIFGESFDTLECVPLSPIDVMSFIDHIEDLRDDRFELDYTRDMQSCTVTVTATPGRINVSREMVSVTLPTPRAPSLLFESFFVIRNCLLECQKTAE